MSKYHGKSQKLHNLFIIFIICGCLIAILFGISSLSNNHSNKTPTPNFSESSTSTQIAKSSNSSSASFKLSNIDSRNTTLSNSTSSPINTSNNIFNDLPSAIAYGRQCIADHTCNNFKVTNDNGKYVVELY